MSIATLKKKTQARYNNMSVGSKTGFSLNGTHRSQGYVGQTMLSRSLPRTLMKGNVAKGHGGCCGKFINHTIVQSAVTSLNDPSVVKQSSINTLGMLNNKYRWLMNHGEVKPDANKNLNSTQSSYITNVAKKIIGCNIEKKTIENLPNKCANNDAYNKTMLCNYTKPETDYVAMSSSQHLEKLVICSVKNDKFYIPSSMNRTPFEGN